MKKIIILALTIGVLGPAVWASPPELIGPWPAVDEAYLEFADSPFDGLSFDWFHLEDFEPDSLASGPGFDVPGVTATGGSIVIPPPYLGSIDSVDADDGAIDGSGLLGHSMFFTPGSTGITFTFDSGILGTLPTHAGIVWTDGEGDITFEAFDAGGSSLGTVTASHATPGLYSGQTDSDRFYGAIDTGGISKILIKNASGGIEVDHLQYGAASASGGPVIPLPGALLLGMLGLGVVGIKLRKCA
jgi:hypothetical protein